MLQNRVDPFGELVRTSARGAWTGTRGVIHNDLQEIIRPYKLKAWITCKLEFKGRRRKMMSPNKYTELFFLDEATAFSAGHRPCCECRRDDFNRFKFFWLKGNPGYGFNHKTSIKEIDEIIHAERINRDRSKTTFEEDIENIPGGTFISMDEKVFLILNNQMFLWSAFGYSEGIALLKKIRVVILTPSSVVNTFRAGYLPQIAMAGIMMQY